MSRARTVSLSAIFAAAIVGGAVLLSRGTIAAPKVSGSHVFDEVRTRLREQYIDTLDDNRLYRMAVDGLVSELGDPYSAFLPPDRLRLLSERTSGNYAGIGLQVDLRDGSVVVVNPLPGGPADRAGILTGDRISEVDGRSLSGWTRDEVERLLRGQPGSTINVTIDRAGGKPLKLILTRAPIHQSAVLHPVTLANNVAYVELRTFSDSTVDELTRTVDSLVTSGAQSLIVDVRGNPGGFLEQGVRASDLFLDRGQRIVSTRGRVEGADHEYVDESPQRWPRLRLAVLVDDRTASAAEIFAGALQDHDRAVIIGLPTYGKGSAQNLYSLDSAGALKLTTARWYTPVGRSISKSRVSADDRDTAKSKEPPKYTTDSGRTVIGGGGIVPDLRVGDTTVPIENLAFQRALGNKTGQFRDALASYALAAKAARSIQTIDFAVTPAMLDDIYRRMTARDVTVPRSTYDSASALVGRLLSYEIARYVFGTDGYFRRRASNDRVIETAQHVLSSSRSQHEALERAAAVPPPRVATSATHRHKASGAFVG